MAVTISAAKYPEYSAGTGISGKRLVMYLNYGTGATAVAPVWTLIGGLTSNSLSFSAEASSQQTKDSGMWPNAAITGKSYEVSAEVIMLRDNEAQEAIEQFIIDDSISNAKKLLNIAIVDLDSHEYYDLTVAPTAWEITAESEDMITKSFTATGSGAPEKKTSFPLAGNIDVTFSKAAAADVVFTVTRGTITGLKKGASAVTSSNYTIATGGQSIIIKSSYLSSLTNGDTEFSILMGDDGAIPKVIKITA